MANIIDSLSLPFGRYALIVAILIAFTASLVGTPLVLKRYSFAGFGLSNVAFMATALAVIIGINQELYIVMPLTVAASIIILRFGGQTKIRGDAALAMISIAAIAIGYFLLNTFISQEVISSQLGSWLFGTNDILELTQIDVWVAAGTTIVVLALFLFLYNKIFAVTFDSNFLQANGQKAKIYELVIATIVGIVVALSMQLVGALLTSALIIFPSLSAMRVAKNYKRATIIAAIIAVGCAILGILVSFAMDAPSGVMIIIVNIVTFIVFFFAGMIFKRRLAGSSD